MPVQLVLDDRSSQVPRSAYSSDLILVNSSRGELTSNVELIHVSRELPRENFGVVVRVDSVDQYEDRLGTL